MVRRLIKGILVCVFVMMVLARPSLAAGLSPDDALKAFKPRPGFEVTLCASEPLIKQPVNIMFDQRGRMWVVQYLQYPHPAGIKPLSVDQYLRTQYDKVPPPP